MRSIDSLTEEELLEFIGSVMYYIGIFPYDFEPDYKMPQHEMIGGVRMALRRMLDAELSQPGGAETKEHPGIQSDGGHSGQVD